MSKILIYEATMKLALEALENHEGNYKLGNAGCDRQEKAITALREALAEREAVLPGGGHVPAVPVAVYGYCPECGGAGVMRERRPNGDDKCTNGHKYLSLQALAEQPAPAQGWKLVPVKPTKEMVDALCDTDPERDSIWDAVLAAAPQPAQRKPLTNKEFEVLHHKAKGYVHTGLMDVVRIVEHHHGIKENT